MKISMCMFSHLPFLSYPKLSPQPRQRKERKFAMESYTGLGAEDTLFPPPSHPYLSDFTSIKQKALCHEDLKKTPRWN